nr:hypothetical protein B0A51_00817 [Rachicladosporium sp. CCFEE 5018]
MAEPNGRRHSDGSSSASSADFYGSEDAGIRAASRANSTGLDSGADGNTAGQDLALGSSTAEMDTATHTGTPGDAPVTDMSSPYTQTATQTAAQTAAHSTSSDSNIAIMSNGHHTNGHVIVQVDEDSGSEMDVSDTSSEASLAEPSTPEQPVHAGSKRKLDLAGPVEEDAAPAVEEPQKKRRLSDVPAGKARPRADGSSAANYWTDEMWQHIFIRSPPAMLARCMQVSKRFNTLLTRTTAPPASRGSGSRLRLLDSEYIWMHSRKNAYPNLPRPLQGFKELDMLRLIGCRDCQACGKVGVRVTATSAFNTGPGDCGVRVIWSFKLRLCGSCFQTEALTDIELMQRTSTASSLRLGLPHAFRTPDRHYVYDLIRQAQGGIPGHLRIVKTFLKKDLATITDELSEVKSFGEGTADEWRKGLAQRGKDAMADASRWERWEQNLPPGIQLGHWIREYDLASFPHHLDNLLRDVSEAKARHESAQTNGAAHHQQPDFQAVHAQGYVPAPGTPQQFQPVQPAQPTHRVIRNPADAKAARDARRADIERRCLALDPPLQPAALDRIKAFHNTMQLTATMTDQQWENMLKPKLLEEREAAELEVHEANQRLAALQAAMPTVYQADESGQPTKENYDHAYELSQQPLRNKLSEYAIDYINGVWLGGRTLNYQTCPRFAVEVIQEVTKRYHEDREAASKKVSPAPESSKTSTPSPEPFLSLDNMKWVYENRIKPYTEQYRREPFQCAGCAKENLPFKWFGFEGLIQHYGAKHTDAFSQGNIVVHWQSAEWPEELPFNSTFPDGMDRRPHHKLQPYQRANGMGRFAVTSTALPPMDGPMLNNNPLFRNGQNGHGHNGAPAMPETPEIPKETMVQQISTDARDVWDKLDGVPAMMDNVRMQVMIHHVNTRFAEHFKRAPELDRITDALATNALMRPIKTTNVLACKPCVADQTDGSANYKSYFQRVRNLKLYNASSLITHFKIVHQPHGRINWEHDMIEMPEMQLISELIRAPGMDDEKLALVAAAFPSAFPSPLPVIGTVTDMPSGPDLDNGLANRLMKKFAPKKTEPPQSKKSKKKGKLANGNGREDSEPLPQPKEDEYDPRKPMFAPSSVEVKGKAAEPDLSKYDTDLARKESKAAYGGSGLAGSYQLAPETLAALSNLTALTKSVEVANAAKAGAVNGSATNGFSAPMQVDDRERSPSVGAPEPRAATTNGHKPAATAVPDIAAILAQLNPMGLQAAGGTATPQSATTAYGQRSSVYEPPPRPQVYTPAAAQPAWTPAEATPAPPSTYGYRASAEPAQGLGQDLQAALARNARAYASNAEQYRPASAVVPQAYAPPPAHTPYATEQQPYLPVSPPRYRRVYDEAPAQPTQYQPVYQQPAQPAYQQYAQEPQYRQPGQPQPYEHRPSYAPAPTQYAPQPVYIDEYGRELVPVEHQLQPQQYAPQQQQYHQGYPAERGYPQQQQQQQQQQRWQG